MIVTEKAEKNLKELFLKTENAGKFLRIFMEGFGWGGPRFGIALDGRKKDNDRETEVKGVKVVFEKELGKFLGDAEIDYRKSFLGGSGFCVNACMDC